MNGADVLLAAALRPLLDMPQPTAAPQHRPTVHPSGQPGGSQQPAPHWARRAEEWTRCLHGALATSVRIEHIGSTAVLGLFAKPIVDLQIAVTDIENEHAYHHGLEELELTRNADEAGHQFYRPRDGNPQTVHVYVCGQGSQWERDGLLFRDRLRSRPELCAAYTGLKLNLASRYRSARAYNQGKTNFIQTVIR